MTLLATRPTWSFQDLKAELKKYKKQLQDLVKLDPERQQQFISLVAKDDFAAAAGLLSS